MEQIIRSIATIENDYTTKFGVPRQSGLVPALRSRIVFEGEYRDPEALRGIEGFSHLWLIWGFSEVPAGKWSATVRPPRLGGNRRLGVFATRSPFRPNALGLSCVRLETVQTLPELGPVLEVSGADLMNGTPIFDIKPYLPYADVIQDAAGGFAAEAPQPLALDFPAPLLEQVPPEKRASLMGVLRLDPRPPYQNDPERVYTMTFGDQDIRFTVRDDTLHVVAIKKL